MHIAETSGLAPIIYMQLEAETFISSNLGLRRKAPCYSPMNNSVSTSELGCFQHMADYSVPLLLVVLHFHTAGQQNYWLFGSMKNETEIVSYPPILDLFHGFTFVTAVPNCDIIRNVTATLHFATTIFCRLVLQPTQFLVIVCNLAYYNAMICFLNDSLMISFLSLHSLRLNRLFVLGNPLSRGHKYNPYKLFKS